MLQALPSNLLPTQPAQLDRDNVFAQSCRLAFVGSMRGVTRGNDYPLTYDSGVTHPLSQYGHQLRGTTTADGAKIASGGISTIMPAASHMTCSMLIRVNTTGSRRLIIGDFDSAGNNGAFGIEQTAASKWRMLVVNTAPTSIEFTSASNVTTGWHFVDLVQTSSSLIGYVDGVQVGSQTMTGVRRAGTDMRVGRGGAFTSLGFDGDIAYCYFFDRAMSVAELLSLRSNPTQIFRLPQQRSRVGVTGGGTLYTKTITGSFTLAGAYLSTYIANRSLGGSIAGVGNIVRTTNKTFTGATTPVGSIAKQTNKNVSGTVTSVGSVLKNTARKLTATITASGALATLFATSRGVAGTFTMAATLATQLYNAVVGGLASRFYTLRRFLGRR